MMLQRVPGEHCSRTGGDEVARSGKVGDWMHAPMPNAQGMDIIRLVRAYLHYAKRESPTIDLRNLNLQWNGIATLFGPSGCGKTSFFRLLSGWFNSTTDAVCDFAGTAESFRDVRFIGSHASLLPWMTIYRNIRFQAGIHDVIQVQALLGEVGLAASTLDLFPYEISLGMYNRVELVIAIVQQPKLLLLDEVFSSLDEENKIAIRDLIMAKRPAGLTLVSAHERELRNWVGSQAFQFVQDTTNGAIIDMVTT